MINSHIQITKAILKNFSRHHEEHREKRIYYLDLKDGEIKTGNPKKVGVKKGYYSEKLENDLSKYVESDFITVVNKVREFARNKKQGMILQFSDIDKIKQFFVYSILRSPYMLKEVNKKLLSCGIVISHENLIRTIQYDNELRRYCIEYVNEYVVTICENKSNLNFVVPMNCFYYKIPRLIVPMNDKIMMYKPSLILMPVTPKIAIMLIHKSRRDTAYLKPKTFATFIMEKDEEVQSYNKMALEMEKKYSNMFVVAKEKQELEYLQKHLR